MLTIKCAGCKRKLWKYRKAGPGAVLRCHKSRMARVFGYRMQGDKVVCACGRAVGIDKGSYFRMIGQGFTYSGTKDPG
jgi:hypothetical protein